MYSWSLDPGATIMNERIKLGISTCLLGEKVRYDGDQKLDAFIVKTLGRSVDFVPVCPEHECGLPVPREPMWLVGDPAAPRLITHHTEIDHTGRMKRWTRRRLDELEEEQLSGYIFKSKSPSCGTRRVKVYDDKGVPHPTGVGLWARAFTARFPTLPIVDEARLEDPKLRELFIERIFLFERWRALCAGRRSLGKLEGFHEIHRIQIMAHSPRHCRELGLLVERGKGVPVAKIFEQYLAGLTAAMHLEATVKKQVKTLRHVMSHLNEQLGTDEKQDLLEAIDLYAKSRVPQIVPLTLIAHALRRLDQSSVRAQTYLKPHPCELNLRNHA
jgi:uncharacterized protein YbbK (DUF523 family)/uncharacterized protein YbgA (DUF1722 family)